MRFVSTRGQTAPVTFDEALLGGLAPDGGLFMPEGIPTVTPSFVKSLPESSLIEIADQVMAPYLDDLEAGERVSLVRDALDFEIPLVELGSGIHLLELFHGPTMAFKDVGARFMARLVARSIRRKPRALMVLVATSGDTGSAVAQAFFGLDSIRVAILYPEGKVSRFQEKQFTTLGGNVRSFAVQGDFDDCQRLVKGAFLDAELRRELGLTSANSINVARLLPQMVPYFWAIAQLGRSSLKPVFSVPSGNFGNLTAGLMARAMGLACHGFAAATNANDVVPRYLESGYFEPRPACATISNAMDVGDPSNFERIAWLFGGDAGRLRESVTATSHSDRATRDTIRKVYETYGYVLDPHTAVGYLGLRRVWKDSGKKVPGVVLATAHPAKFSEVVESILGVKTDPPDRLTRYLELPTKSIPVRPDLGALAAALRE